MMSDLLCGGHEILACPNATDVLMAIASGRQIHLDFSRGWITEPSFCAEIKEEYVEWLFERGFAFYRCRQLHLTPNGYSFLRGRFTRFLGSIRQMEPLKWLDIDSIRLAASEIKNNLSDYGHFERTYLLSSSLLHTCFGQEWTANHLDFPTSAEQFIGRHNNDEWLWYRDKLRVIHLAEMISNLLGKEGLATVMDRIRSGSVEAGYSELEVGKMLYERGMPFRFRPSSYQRGMDYDFDIMWNGTQVAADVKCKIEENKISKNGVLNSLNTGRKQLPSDRPGVIFLKIPFSKNETCIDRNAFELVEQAAVQFLRGTERVVLVVAYQQVTMDLDPSMSIIDVLIPTSYVNKNHKFDPSVDWKLPNQDPNKFLQWSRFFEICA